MNVFKTIWNGITSRLFGFSRGVDIAVDNLVLDDGVDHTISGDSAIHPALKPLKKVLDATLPGGAHGKHCENAAYDDAAEENALNEAEGGQGMWIYQQSTGMLSHDGSHIGEGYAGGNIPPHFDATAKNNPARQSEHYFGPLPQGFYTIGVAHTEPLLGPVAMRLYPDDTNVMFGRSDFFIHADSIADPGQASEGCIVMPNAVRSLVAASIDRRLTVVA